MVDYNAEEVTIPEVSEGWHASWHPFGEALLPEHVTVISSAELPWDAGSTAEQIDDALLYNWLDQANMFHVMMETGNFIYATACKLLGACTHATSHYQILATVSAVLCYAVLCCAVLCCAVLCCAVLCCVALCCCAVLLCCAVLCCAVLLTASLICVQLV